MKRVKKTKNSKPYPKEWVVDYFFTMPNGQMVEEGDSVGIVDRRGVFVFKNHVVNTLLKTDKEWINLYGGTKNHKSFVAVRPDQVRPLRGKTKKVTERAKRINADRKARRSKGKK